MNISEKIETQIKTVEVKERKFNIKVSAEELVLLRILVGAASGHATQTMTMFRSINDVMRQHGCEFSSETGGAMSMYRDNTYIYAPGELFKNTAAKLKEVK